MAVLYNCACNTKQPLRFLLFLTVIASSAYFRSVALQASVQLHLLLYACCRILSQMSTCTSTLQCALLPGCAGATGEARQVEVLSSSVSPSSDPDLWAVRRGLSELSAAARYLPAPAVRQEMEPTSTGTCTRIACTNSVKTGCFEYNNRLVAFGLRSPLTVSKQCLHCTLMKATCRLFYYAGYFNSRICNRSTCTYMYIIQGVLMRDDFPLRKWGIWVDGNPLLR